MVEAVASGTDWSAITASITTGLVGLAGIFMTYRQGKRAQEAESKNLMTSIAAENARACLTEKRRIYARCLALFDDLGQACMTYRLAKGENCAQATRDAITEEYTMGCRKASNAREELRLLASRDIYDLASKLMDAVMNSESDQDVGSLFDQLGKAMRNDLDKPIRL